MTSEGRLDLDRLACVLTARCRLVALTHCSNVTGALTDVGRVVAVGPLDTRDRLGVTTFSVEGFSAEAVCRDFLDSHGVALRGGHHRAQPLVRAFGVEGAVRASLAPYSQEADVAALLLGREVVRSMRRPSLRRQPVRTAR